MGGIILAESLNKIKKVKIVYIEDEKEKEKEITVQKAGLGKYKKLSDIFKTIMNIIPEYAEEQGIDDVDEYIQSMTYIELLNMIPDLLTYSIDQFIDLLILGSDLEKDFAEENLGLDEAFDILDAIIKVNGLIKVVEKGKNLMNRLGLGGAFKAEMPEKQKEKIKKAKTQKKNSTD